MSLDPKSVYIIQRTDTGEHWEEVYVSGSNLVFVTNESGSVIRTQTLPSGITVTASYIDFDDIANLPDGLMSSSQQTVENLVSQSVDLYALTASYITVENLDVTFVSSSIIYSSGSNIFGDNQSDTHEFTGSVNITGSLQVSNGITGSLSGTASYALNADAAEFAVSASYANTASYSLKSETVITNANLTGDVTSVGNATTLATVNSTIGTFGGATAIPIITVNAKGLVTSVSTASISATVDASTLTGTTLAPNVISASLSSIAPADGTLEINGILAAISVQATGSLSVLQANSIALDYFGYGRVVGIGSNTTAQGIVRIALASSDASVYTEVASFTGTKSIFHRLVDFTITGGLARTINSSVAGIGVYEQLTVNGVTTGLWGSADQTVGGLATDVGFRAVNNFTINAGSGGQIRIGGNVIAATGSLDVTGNITSYNGAVNNSGFFLRSTQHIAALARYDAIGSGSALLSSFGNVGVMINATVGTFGGALVGTFNNVGLALSGNVALGGASLSNNIGVKWVGLNSHTFGDTVIGPAHWQFGPNAGGIVGNNDTWGFYSYTSGATVLHMVPTGVTIGGFLAVTGSFLVSGSLVVNGPITVNTNGQGYTQNATLGTDSAYSRWVNTGGSLYIGLDNSVGGVFGTAGSYGTVVNRPAGTGFAISRVGTVDMSIDGTGQITVRDRINAAANFDFRGAGNVFTTLTGSAHYAVRALDLVNVLDVSSGSVAITGSLSTTGPVVFGTTIVDDPGVLLLRGTAVGLKFVTDPGTVHIIAGDTEGNTPGAIAKAMRIYSSTLYLMQNGNQVLVVSPGKAAIFGDLEMGGTIKADSITPSGTLSITGSISASNATITGTLTALVNGDLTGSLPNPVLKNVVTPGSFTNANITIDAKGRVTAATSGAAGGAVDAGSLTGTTLAANVVNASLNNITPIGGTFTVSGSVNATNGIYLNGALFALGPVGYHRVYSLANGFQVMDDVGSTVRATFSAAGFDSIGRVTATGNVEGARGIFSTNDSTLLTLSRNTGVAFNATGIDAYLHNSANVSKLVGRLVWSNTDDASDTGQLQIHTRKAGAVSATAVFSTDSLTLISAVSVNPPADYTGLNVQRGTRNAGFTQGPNANEGPFMFLNNSTPTTGKSWSLRSYDDGTLNFYESANGAIMSLSTTSLSFAGRIFVSGEITATAFKATAGIAVLSANTVVMDNPGYGRILGIGTNPTTQGTIHFSVASSDATQYSEIAVFSGTQAVFNRQVDFQVAGGQARLLSSTIATGVYERIVVNGVTTGYWGSADQTMGGSATDLGFQSTNNFRIGSGTGGGVMFGSNTVAFTGNTTITSGIGGNNLDIGQNHQTQDAIRIHDTHASPFHNWRIGIGVGTGANELDFYNETATIVPLRLSSTGIVVAGTITATGTISGGALTTAGTITATGNISAANFSGTFSGTHSGASSGTNTGDQTNIPGNAATANSSPLLSALNNYVWAGATTPSGYPLGQQLSFVQAANGFQNYGTVITSKGYSGGGGSLQMFIPYGPGYGGTGLQMRFGNYEVNSGDSWTGWKTVLASDNYTSYAPSLTGGGASGTWAINITGNAGSITNQANSATITSTSGNVANQIVSRDANGDFICRYIYSSYLNMSHAASGITTDTIFYSSGDDYIRKNNATGFRASLNVPTRTGGDASGTWPIAISGQANNTMLFMSTSHNGTYWLVNNWDGTYWSITSNHGAGVRVAYADTVGNANTATTLIGNETNWQSYRQSAVANMLGWKNYGNAHVLFDASAATAPNGTAIDRNNPATGWTTQYGNIMGWNGSQTFGVRVDSCRNTDFASSAPAAGLGGNTLSVGVVIGSFNTITPAGTGALQVNGELRATGNVIAYYSDDRLKTRFGNIENALDKVRSLNGFYYEANETAQALGYKAKREVGVSAQAVQKVLPEVVVSAPIDDKYLTVQYEKLVPLLIEAIKELDREFRAYKETHP